MVGQERGACDAEVQDAWADTGEAVQHSAQAGPQAFPGVAVHTRTGRVTTRIRAGAMGARPMVRGGRSALVNVRRIGDERRPDLHLGGDQGCDGRGAPIVQHCQIDWRSGSGRGGRVTALHPAQQGWTTPLGSGATASTWGARWRVGSRGDVSSMPPSRTGIHRCAVRSWMSAAAAMSLAFRCHCYQPLTNNHARGCHVRSAKIALVPSVPMAHGGPTRTAQANQWKRCRPLSHRARGSTASLRPRGHVRPSGQRHCRKESAAFWASCRNGRRCFMGLLPWEVRNPMRPILPG